MSTVRTIPDSGAGRAQTALRTVLPASIHLVVLRSLGPTLSVKVAGRRLRLVWGGEGWRRDIEGVIGDPHCITPVSQIPNEEYVEQVQEWKP